MAYAPLKDRVILRRIDKEADTSSPFITPEVAKTKASECEVVSISGGYTSDFGVQFYPPVSVGDRCLIGKYSGSEHKVDGEDLLFARWDELLAVEVLPAHPSALPNISRDDAKDYTTPLPVAAPAPLVPVVDADDDIPF
jgi:chaperonin GroES